jgi:hypothetical protein
MKSIRISILIIIAGIAGLFIISCGSTEDKLVGTWVTESVVANVDSSLANLSSIDQNIASTKTTKFILNEDHSMALSIDGYTTDAFWTYNNDNDRLSFRLEAEVLNDAIELGKFDGKKIIYTSSVKHGTITAVYVKE